MTYQSSFSGCFNIVPSLRAEHRRYLLAFSETRRVRRDAAITAGRPDEARLAVGLPVGEEGGYFVAAGGMLGQEGGGPMFDPGGSSAASLGIIDFNRPPQGQPHLWCCWQPTGDGAGLQVPEEGAHYDPLTWLQYLQVHFLVPWGYTLHGEVAYRGSEALDAGRFVANGADVAVIPEHGRAPLSEAWSARERGEAFFAKKDWSHASEEFELALTRAPQWPDPWWMKGMVLGQMGRHEECLACLEQSLKKESDADRRQARRIRLHGLLRRMVNAQAGLERARAYRAASNFAEAILEYQAFIAALPDEEKNSEDAVSARIGLGLSYQGAGQIEAAFAVYYEVTQTVPEDPSGWTYAAYLMAYQYNKPQEAVPFFAIAIGTGNDSSVMFNELGMARGRCGQHAEARDAFVQGANADPDDPLPWFNLAHTFLVLKNPAEAVVCFQRAAELKDPRCYDAALAGLAEAKKLLG